jgi:hypothetical protein
MIDEPEVEILYIPSFPLVGNRSVLHLLKRNDSGQAGMTSKEVTLLFYETIMIHGALFFLILFDLHDRHVYDKPDAAYLDSTTRVPAVFMIL